MRRRALLALLALPACAAAPPPASPAEPPAAEPAEAVVPPGRSLDAEMAESRSRVRVTSRRAPVSTEAFRVADLALVTLPEPINTAVVPLMSGREQATDLEVEWGEPRRPNRWSSARLRVRGAAIARLRIGTTEVGLVRGSTEGLQLACGGPDDAPGQVVAARWETLEPERPQPDRAGTEVASGRSESDARSPSAPRTGVHFRVTNAWFDFKTCSARVVSRGEVIARPLAGGALYAFRERCKSCGDGQVVTILSPRFDAIQVTAVGAEAATTQGVFGRAILPLRRGGAASLLAHIGGAAASTWATALGASGLPAGELTAGVDLIQGVDDSEPTAIAYVGVAPLPHTGKRARL
jgi:hypothetical protein